MATNWKPRRASAPRNSLGVGFSSGWRFWAGLFSFFVAVAPARLAAQPAKAFSELAVHVSRAQNLPNSDAFFRFWRPGYGFEGSLSTPFYFGEAETGLAWHTYNADDPAVPRAQAYYLFAGWGLPATLGPAQLLAGFRIGNYRMDFQDNSSPYASESDESEFSYTTLARIGLRLTENAGLSATLSRTTVFTHHRLYYTYANLGLTVRFKTGQRFQDALR